MKTNKKEKFIMLLIVAALGLTTLGYYFWTKLQPKQSEIPPSITIASNRFQGLISGDVVCQIPGLYTFTDEQINAYVKPGDDNDSNWHALEHGVRIYHAPENMTVKQILDSIIPTSGNKIMVAYYIADNENATKKFAMYPPQEDSIAIGDASIYTIPANQGIIIFSCKDTKIWKVRTEKMTSDAVSSVLATKNAGWILIPSVTNQALKDTLSQYQNKIKSVWVQKDAGFDINSFEKAGNLQDAATKNGYTMVWLKIGPVEQNQPSQPQQPSQPTPAQQLEAPGNFNAAVNGNTVTLNWNIPSGVVTDDLYGYILDYGKGDVAGIQLEKHSELAKTFNQYTVTGLQYGQKYWFSLAAVDLKKYELGKIGKQSTIFATTAQPSQPQQPVVQNSITITKNTGGNKQVDIEWTDSASQNVNKYLISRSKTSPVDTSTSKGNYVDSNPPGNLVGNISSAAAKKFTDTMLLEDNTTYYYIIKSRDSSNNVIGTSQEVTVKTTPALTPSDTPNPGSSCGTYDNPCLLPGAPQNPTNTLYVTFKVITENLDQIAVEPGEIIDLIKLNLKSSETTSVKTITLNKSLASNNIDTLQDIKIRVGNKEVETTSIALASDSITMSFAKDSLKIDPDDKGVEIKVTAKIKATQGQNTKYQVGIVNKNDLTFYADKTVSIPNILGAIGDNDGNLFIVKKNTEGDYILKKKYYY